MRLPTLTRLIPSPRGVIKSLAYQAVGVIILVLARKFVPNVWGQWATFVVAAGMGVWFPLTDGILRATKIQDHIENW